MPKLKHPPRTKAAAPNGRSRLVIRKMTPEELNRYLTDPDPHRAKRYALYVTRSGRSSQ